MENRQNELEVTNHIKNTHSNYYKFGTVICVVSLGISALGIFLGFIRPNQFDLNYYANSTLRSLTFLLAIKGIRVYEEKQQGGKSL
jgi:hypothetical protein